jgi:autotransporter-associated beta strand protein
MTFEKEPAMRRNTVWTTLFGAMMLFLGVGRPGLAVDTKINFEDVGLGTDGYYKGVGNVGGFVSHNTFFPDAYYEDPEYGYNWWENWACSQLTTTEMPESYDPADPYEFWRNFPNLPPEYELSAKAGGGNNGSQKFGVAYPAFDMTTFQNKPVAVVFQQPVHLTSAFFSNTTYSSFVTRDGNRFAQPFTAGDHLQAKITGKDIAGQTTGLVNVVLADYPEGGSLFLLDNWSSTDLSGLGSNVKSLEITWESTDWGSPTYVAIDDLTIAGNLYEAAWTGEGTNNHWSNPDNFGGVHHEVGKSLLFAGTKNLRAENDFPDGRQFAAVTFGKDAGAFTLVGNPLRLKYDLANLSANTQTVDLPIVLDGGNQSILTALGDIVVSKPIGEESGKFGIAKTGKYTLTLDGENTYTGPTNVAEGTLALDVGGEISAESAIHVSAGAMFSVLDGVHTVGVIDGKGTTQVLGDAQLTAVSITQGTLIIGTEPRIGGAAHPIPEPGTLILLATAALLGVSVYIRRAGWSPASMDYGMRN